MAGDHSPLIHRTDDSNEWHVGAKNIGRNSPKPQTSQSDSKRNRGIQSKDGQAKVNHYVSLSPSQLSQEVERETPTMQQRADDRQPFNSMKAIDRVNDSMDALGRISTKEDLL